MRLMHNGAADPTAIVSRTSAARTFARAERDLGLTGGTPRVRPWVPDLRVPAALPRPRSSGIWEL